VDVPSPQFFCNRCKVMAVALRGTFVTVIANVTLLMVAPAGTDERSILPEQE